MVSDHDRELLETLTRLNMAITSFSMDLFSTNLAREDHIELALLLINAADGVLKRLLDGEGT